MNKPVNHTSFIHLGVAWQLLPDRAAFLPDFQTLLLADIHLGKAAHFRKNGIPVSGQIHMDDLSRLSELILTLKAKTIIFLGDLFHSDANNEWFQFTDFLQVFPAHQFILVKGNHDILPTHFYDLPNMEVKNSWVIGPFSFTHQQEISEDLYNISGHVHPGVKIGGPGKQHLRLPCFYFAEKYGLMPAFGLFTGIHPIRIAKNDRVYGIVEDNVVQLN